MSQNIVAGAGCHRQLEALLREHGVRKFMLVCDRAFDLLPASDYFAQLALPFVRFDRFGPNPLYEDVVQGVEQFCKEGCDALVAVGGGSALDVAKCIKLFAPMDPKQSYLEQEYTDSGLLLIALPTTAGTGSESTRYAVIYAGGQKQSIAHPGIVPQIVLLDHAFVQTLPLYQKKCTVLDALCQSIESWWSVHSTAYSIALANEAIGAIVAHMDAYLAGDPTAAGKIMKAANLSGQAINLTQTTAAHAMSYKMTSLYGLPHGHAVALCLPKVWDYMRDAQSPCVDARGRAYLEEVFLNIAGALGASCVQDAIVWFEEKLRTLEIASPQAATEEELEILASSVNPVRLKNNPVGIGQEEARALYQKICTPGC